jgi:hypothetical protein
MASPQPPRAPPSRILLLTLTQHLAIVAAPWSVFPNADRCPDEVEMRQRASILIIAASLSVTALPGCAGTGQSLFRYLWPNTEPVADKKTQVQEQTAVSLPSKDSRPSFCPSAEESEPPAIPGVPSRQGMVAPFLLDQHGSEPLHGLRVPEYAPVPPPLAQCDFTHTTEPLPPAVPDQPVHQAAVSPPETAEPLVLAMQCLSNNKPQEAMEHLQRCHPANQEFFMRLLPIMAVLKDKSIDQLNVQEATALQEQVQQLLLAVVTRSDLVVDKMCLCERIEGYGHYTPKRDGYAFKAGTSRQKGDMVNVYIEVRNLACVPHGRYYTTLLNGSVRIRDHQGTTVWSYNYRESEQPLLSGEPRSDWSRAYDFFVPAIPPGRYTLSIEVVDETCQPHRVAQKSVELLVAAP